MQGYGPGAPRSEGHALSAFLRALNIPPDLIPVDADERTALYRSVTSQRRLMIVLDNVASARQVRRLLPGSGGCLVVVTSRTSLSDMVAREGATRVTLDVLPLDAAVQLLAEVIGDDRVEAEDAAARQIAEHCGCLPLALRVVAERAARRPHLSLAELAGELGREQDRLQALAAHEDESGNIRAVFSWSYRALPAERQRVFRAIGLHAGPEFSSAVIGALAGLASAQADDHLQELARVHLVEEISIRRYRTHDLLREYALERGLHEDRQRARTHAVRRGLQWYLLASDDARQAILPYSQALPLVRGDDHEVFSFSDAQSAMDWYELERANILAALRQAMDFGQFDIAWRLPVVCDGFFELHSYWDDWRSSHETALSAALTISDSLGEASARRCLGDSSWEFDEFASALSHYERAAEIAEDIRDPWIEGFAVRGMGLVKMDTGQPQQAMSYFERARQVFESAGNSRGTGMALLSLGGSRKALGDLAGAVRDCESALLVFREIGDRWSLAWGLLSLSDVHVEAADLESAIFRLDEAVAIFRDFGDRQSEATCLANEARVLRLNSDMPAARDRLSAALDIYEALGDPRAVDVRAQLSELG
jgi:tetratricopeptide (TPR) repeat protein